LKLSKKQVLGSYGETKLGQGRDAVKSLIKDNPELADELEVKLKRIKELADA
jgi:recombination protein RecA